METKHWPRIKERNGFVTGVVMHAPDYDVVETFGNNLLIVSKDGHKNVTLSRINNSEVIYPQIKDPRERHLDQKSTTVYSAPK